ncbi:MAG: hypothetical protein NTV57_19715 [Cyanobacteria bacterium]|nr:hypothetical protein [Cyanobacteriota bacterium]
MPIAALPLMLTAITGVIFSILEQKEIEADWLLQIHSGHFGPINLQPYYAYVLGFCLLLLIITGLMMWFRTRRRSRAKD